MKNTWQDLFHNNTNRKRLRGRVTEVVLPAHLKTFQMDPGRQITRWIMPIEGAKQKKNRILMSSGFQAAGHAGLRPDGCKKLLTTRRSGYTFMSAIHKGRLHSAIARFSVVSRISLEQELIR